MSAITRGFSAPSRLLILASILLIAASCDQSSTQMLDSVSEQGELRITPAESMIDNGATVQLQAHRVFPDGRAVPVSGPVTWTSSSSAVGNVSSSGIVTARLPGEVTIRAETNRESASARIVILPVSADLRLVVTDEIEVEAGDADEAPVSARVMDVTGRPVPGVQVDFDMIEGSGDAVSLRRVSGEDGFAHASVPVGTEAGEYELEITSPGFSSSESSAFGDEEAAGARNRGHLRKNVRLLVRPSHPEVVRVTPGFSSVAVGEVDYLTVEVIDNFGNLIMAPSLTWTPGDAEVVEVKGEGELRGLATGETGVTVQATDSKGRTAEGRADVEVRSTEETAAAAAEVHSGDGQTGDAGNALSDPLAVRVLDAQGGGVPGVSVTWTLASGVATLSRASSTTDSGGIASVNVELGTVAGTIEIRAEVAAVGSLMFQLAASAGPAASVDLSPETLTLEPGGSHRFTASVADEFGNPLGSPSLEWSSANSQVAAVNQDGRVTALSSGTTWIAARAGDGDAACCPSDSVLVQVDQVEDSDGGDESTAEAPGQVDDLTVLTATENSVTLHFTEVSDGDGGAANYQIRYRASSDFGNWGTAAVVESGSCGEPVDGIAVGNARECEVPGLASGTDHTFRLVSRRTEDGGWVYGPLSNIASGATDATNDGSGSGTTDPSALSIAASTTSLTALGQSTQLSVTAEDEDGNATDLPSSITWSSSDTNVATVNSSGRVTARAIGAVAISVAAACCAGDQVIIDVSQEIASVHVSPSSLTLESGERHGLSAEARDANGYPVPGVSFDWESSVPTVVTVDSSGVVSALDIGDARVLASASSHEAEASIQVSEGGGDSGTSDPDDSGAGDGVFPHAPVGWNVLIDSGFGYSDITWKGDDWFDIDDSQWAGRAPDPPRPISLRSDSNGPISSPNAIRFSFSEGATDGSSPAGRMFSAGINVTAGGVFYAYSMRLSSNWQQNPTEITGNTMKHVEFRSDSGLVARTGITKIPNDPQERYRVKLANWTNSDIPDHILDSSTAWSPGEWITVEVLVRYNQDGQPNSGSMKMWVNGNQAASLENTNLPISGFTGIQAANVFGGGIGDVPHDQWYEFDHFFLSVR